MPASKLTLHFVLYSRSWCHLCEDMQAALAACMERLGRAYTLAVIDVDADPELVARYDELVPVLLGPDGAEICHYFLDEAALTAALHAAPTASA